MIHLHQRRQIMIPGTWRNLYDRCGNVTVPSNEGNLSYKPWPSMKRSYVQHWHLGFSISDRSQSAAIPGHIDSSQTPRNVHNPRYLLNIAKSPKKMEWNGIVNANATLFNPQFLRNTLWKRRVVDHWATPAEMTRSILPLLLLAWLVT